MYFSKWILLLLVSTMVRGDGNSRRSSNAKFAIKVTPKAPMVQFLKNGSLPLNSKPISPHIIAGSAVSLISQIPWQVGLKIKRSETYSFYCGGSLIHQNWVVSAAHCTFKGIQFDVRLGSLSPTSGGVMITSAYGYTHKGYDANNLKNDIGLIYLPTPAPLSNNIKVITIVATNVLSFTSLIVSGWGKTTDGATTISSSLQVVPVTAITNTECSSSYGSVITVNSICTVGKLKQSPCQGDSGGPLFMNSSTPYLVGVVSFVSSTGCESGLPSGYVRPQNYRSWITSTTGLKL